MPIRNSGEISDKLKARDFNATSLSTYDFSTLYTTLPHNFIKDKLIDLIEKDYAWSCQNVCDALTFLLDNLNSFDLAPS